MAGVLLKDVALKPVIFGLSPRLNGLQSYEKNWYIGIDVSKKWLDVAIFVENSDLKGIRKKQSLAERERHGEGEYVAYEKEQALQEGERSL